MLPRRWRQAAPRRHTLVLQVERPFARVYERRGRRLESVGSLVLGDASPGTPTPPVEFRLRQALARHKNATVLVLGEDDALTITDALPAAAEGDIARIMAHKLDLLTPWSAEQGYTARRFLAAAATACSRSGRGLAGPSGRTAAAAGRRRAEPDGGRRGPRCRGAADRRGGSASCRGARAARPRPASYLADPACRRHRPRGCLGRVAGLSAPALDR